MSGTGELEKTSNGNSPRTGKNESDHEDRGAKVFGKSKWQEELVKNNDDLMRKIGINGGIAKERKTLSTHTRAHECLFLHPTF